MRSENTRFRLVFLLGIFSCWNDVIHLSITAEIHVSNGPRFVKYNAVDLNNWLLKSHFQNRYHFWITTLENINFKYSLKTKTLKKNLWSD